MIDKGVTMYHLMCCFVLFYDIISFSICMHVYKRDGKRRPSCGLPCRSLIVSTICQSYFFPPLATKIVGTIIICFPVHFPA
jgi:hypothetical protein